MAGDEEPPLNHDHPILGSFITTVHDTLNKPVVWFRKNVVEPRREPYPWYHRKYNRVPTIDECYVDDLMCREEADLQFK